eukprot:TRINITY_DN18064_c0_g1_i1.p1 TRINITY_DN18064_c0_g1~~TRINITY_DN18064_c0_g1_i1.p1  ORF type:complete len:202 (-),score=51.92 TRINITY_DN18064_c0_g1_i1:81-662(-)
MDKMRTQLTELKEKARNVDRVSEEASDLRSRLERTTQDLSRAKTVIKSLREKNALLKNTPQAELDEEELAVMVKLRESTRGLEAKVKMLEKERKDLKNQLKAARAEIRHAGVKATNDLNEKFTAQAALNRTASLGGPLSPINSDRSSVMSQSPSLPSMPHIAPPSPDAQTVFAPVNPSPPPLRPSTVPRLPIS